MRRAAVLLVILSLSMVGIGTGSAASIDADMLGPDFRVSGSGGVPWEVTPAIAWNATNQEYLVVWRTDRDLATRGWDIRGRRLSAAGVPVGNDFRVSGPNATTHDYSPAVAWNATDNQYLVVWSDGRSSATRGADIYGRRLASNGTPVGGDIRVSGPLALGTEEVPDVVWNATANEYLVVWEDGRNTATRGKDIWGRRVRGNGALAGNDFRVSGTGATTDDMSPAVAWNQTANQYYVVWTDLRDPGRLGDIFGRRVGADGAVVGDDSRVTAAATMTEDSSPAIAWNATSNEYLVVWETDRNLATRGVDIVGRRVAASGAPLGGGDVRISGPNALGTESTADAVWNAVTGEFLVVWTDNRSFSTRGWDTYGRRVGGSGVPSSGEFRIGGPNATLGEFTPAIAWNSVGNQYLVVWEDKRFVDTRNGDIYGRRFT